MTEEKKSPFKLIIEIGDDGQVDIVSQGVCHHVFLVGVLESIKHDILNVATNMQGFVPAALKQEEEKQDAGDRTS